MLHNRSRCDSPFSALYGSIVVLLSRSAFQGPAGAVEIPGAQPVGPGFAVQAGIGDHFDPAAARENRLYEYRPQQREMARAVAEALCAGENLCVEAPTGVGKSFAYLVPLILRARTARRGAASPCRTPCAKAAPRPSAT